MDTLTFCFQYGLAAVFLLSGVSKLFDRDGSEEALKNFGVPESLADRGVYLLPAGELAAALLLSIPATARLGATLSAVLLIAFIVAIAMNLRKGNAPDCHCFGQVHSEPISWWTVARNVVLLGMALVVVGAGAESPASAFDWTGELDPDARSLLWMIVAVGGALAMGLLGLWRGQQKILRALRQGGAGVPSGASALPLGVAAPSFALSDLDGNTVTSSSILATGHPAMLVFTSPNCGPCNALLPDVGQWQQTLGHAFSVTVISSGSSEDNRKKAEKVGLTQVLIEKDYEVSNAYGVNGTPSAIALTADGLVSSEVVSGPDGVRALMSRLMSERVHVMWRSATGDDLPIKPLGLEVGEDAPDVRVFGEDGRDLEEEADLPLRDVLAGQRSLLLFWSTVCGFCAQVDPRIREYDRVWAASRGQQMVFVVSSRGEENQGLEVRSPVVFDPTFDAGQEFLIDGTPGALVVDEDGKIATPLAIGTDEVLTLVRNETERFSRTSFSS